MYEDFSDAWRRPDNNKMRYPQRIDVEYWDHYVPNGVLVKGLNRIKLYELQNAAFEIPKSLFDVIVTELGNAERSDAASDDPDAGNNWRSVIQWLKLSKRSMRKAKGSR